MQAHDDENDIEDFAKRLRGDAACRYIARRDAQQQSGRIYGAS